MHLQKFYCEGPLLSLKVVRRATFGKIAVSGIPTRIDYFVMFVVDTQFKNVLADRLGDKIEKNEMGEACSKYGGRESCVQGFGGET
jgi:hypothetical protein